MVIARAPAHTISVTLPPGWCLSRFKSSSACTVSESESRVRPALAKSHLTLFAEFESPTILKGCSAPSMPETPRALAGLSMGVASMVNDPLTEMWMSGDAWLELGLVMVKANMYWTRRVSCVPCEAGGWGAMGIGTWVYGLMTWPLHSESASVPFAWVGCHAPTPIWDPTQKSVSACSMRGCCLEQIPRSLAEQASTIMSEPPTEERPSIAAQSPIARLTSGSLRLILDGHAASHVHLPSPRL
eukprot:3933744-Rhodomonas_salina.1